ncbi:integral membrane family protein [Aspergillus eucalypticola CBS 122712]|uniref:Integral membrane family protein n=1 Tax=Aspergillus eucalypticola (strain CBS 122712 / IBT 29274) TaxID=1448314 RepID=A0A317VQY7_ASPEC|nr:integral membrane family protein [Aspergillus eucalypticola CBS 122712]PWY76723.1 integral membrane family protein [Aspergillus eucalypticola CBS 122712]
MAANSHLGGAGLPDVSQGPQILAATSITTAFALLTVLARMYVRVFFIRNVGPDDYVMVLTMALSLGGFAVIIPEVIYGAGRHTVYVENTASIATHLNFATQGIYMWAIGLVKISIGLFLLRFAPRRGYKIFIWVVMVVMLLYTIICFLTLMFECKDIRSIWDENVKSQCFTSPQLLKLSYTNTGLNVLTDIIFAILPAIMLRHLQVNRRVKASLVCILGLGIFACAAAIVKLSVLPNYGRTGDLLWDYSTLTIWVVVESNMGIIAGSLPTLKPLFKQFLGTYGSQTKTRRYTYGSKKYRLQSLSPSYPQPSVRSRPLSVLDPEDLEEGDPRAAQRNSKYGTTTTKYHYRDGSHTSEEYILTRQESAGIVLTTEVVVTHTTAEQVIRNNRGKRTQLPNEEV